MKYFFKILTLITLLSSCTQGTSGDKVETKEESQFSKNEVAIFTISSIMHQSPSIISPKQENDVYLVSYRRPSNSQLFTYRIKFEGNEKVIWATNDGRWRDSEFDEIIMYKEEGDQLIITQKFSDGSLGNKAFLKNDLEK